MSQQQIQAGVTRDPNRPAGLALTRVSKEDLLTTVRDNRKRHHDTFTSAVAVFRAEVTEKLSKSITFFQNLESSIKTSFGVPETDFIKNLREEMTKASWGLSLTYPEQHLEDYDKTIRKLEMSIDTEIELTDAEFNQYVMDNWSWKGTFTANTVSYSSKAR